MPLCVACRSCIIDMTCGSQWRWHVRDSSTHCSKTFFIWFLCDGFILQMSFSVMNRELSHIQLIVILCSLTILNFIFFLISLEKGFFLIGIDGSM